MYSMAYFSHGDARQKLMLLFFLDKIDFELTRSQFYRIFFENGWMDYFDFQARLTELEEDGHVAALPLAFGHGYRVTPQGKQTLAMFSEELPHSLREKLSECARENRDNLRSEAQFYARQTQLPDGGYHATLRLMDKRAHILDISLQLPTAQLAQAACDAWPKQAEGIYQELLKRLVTGVPAGQSDTPAEDAEPTDAPAGGQAE